MNVECIYRADDPDGTRPVVLRRQIDLLQQELKDQQELLDYLKSVPETDAIELLRRLRSASSPSTVLSHARGNLHGRHRPSEHIAARAIGPPVNNDLEFELMVSHPVAYPVLVPLDVTSIDVNPFPLSDAHASRFPGNFDRPGIDRLAIEPFAVSNATKTPVYGPSQATTYLDHRLGQIPIDYWTGVAVSKELAATLISFYLELDHPFLGLFDADLFINDLVLRRNEFCSPLLVNTLLYNASVREPERIHHMRTERIPAIVYGS